MDDQDLVWMIVSFKSAFLCDRIRFKPLRKHITQHYFHDIL